MIMTIVCIAYILTGVLLMIMDRDKKSGRSRVIMMPAKKTKERTNNSLIS